MQKWVINFKNNFISFIFGHWRLSNHCFRVQNKRSPNLYVTCFVYSSATSADNSDPTLGEHVYVSDDGHAQHFDDQHGGHGPHPHRQHQPAAGAGRRLLRLQRPPHTLHQGKYSTRLLLRLTFSARTEWYHSYIKPVQNSTLFHRVNKDIEAPSPKGRQYTDDGNRLPSGDASAGLSPLT